MSRIYEFIRACGVFDVLTLDGDFPAGAAWRNDATPGETVYFHHKHKGRLFSDQM